MKILLSSVMLLSSMAAFAADDVKLPTPETDKGMPVMKAFAERKSTRKYSSRELAPQDLSNLLWATMGKNREDGHLTAPSCQNKQEIRVFVIDSKGAYEYVPLKNELRHVADGDFRQLVAGRQKFVETAPVSLLIVADMDKFGSTDQRSMMMAAIDAGIVTENACVAAAGLGLATVPRASMDVAALQKALGLGEGQIPMMNLPVGYFE
ncbi:MAG: SagB/ThcOx family dehydrogenase [Muribaculaceae bacterium]|nr:SagB/ThcOx family dehydrogenase [Muribaculaceae bacterium]